MVEHLTADQEVTGSNPVGPFWYMFMFFFLDKEVVNSNLVGYVEHLTAY